VSGYYVRIAPEVPGEARAELKGMVDVRNRFGEASHVATDELISTDALALVRFGLRAADDPRITDTVKVIDRVLLVDLPYGPGWRRYNGDGYGEHEDGSPFDGTGIGRLWPLLTGERAHYELAAGRSAEAERLLHTLEACGSDGHLLPEQVWDADDIPERELFRGCPSGSAMPLVWAHAEHIKLLRSLREGRVFDMPPQPRKRYQIDGMQSQFVSWRPNQKTHEMLAGKIVRIELPDPALVHWSDDNWRTSQDVATRAGPFGMYIADLGTANRVAGDEIVFTFYWNHERRWEGRDFRISVVRTAQA
jgi:glucoamylase